mmetsp:Transcript_20984/g.39901  ORF Transcript_20984/g.39901 Transcript_20984/m.39901 type:complete len:231 (+) Transcript_20984:657-1349(+)
MILCVQRGTQLEEQLHNRHVPVRRSQVQRGGSGENVHDAALHHPQSARVQHQAAQCRVVVAMHGGTQLLHHALLVAPLLPNHLQLVRHSLSNHHLPHFVPRHRQASLEAPAPHPQALMFRLGIHLHSLPRARRRTQHVHASLIRHPLADCLQTHACSDPVHLRPALLCKRGRELQRGERVGVASGVEPSEGGLKSGGVEFQHETSLIQYDGMLRDFNEVTARARLQWTVS